VAFQEKALPVRRLQARQLHSETRTGLPRQWARSWPQLQVAVRSVIDFSPGRAARGGTGPWRRRPPHGSEALSPALILATMAAGFLYVIAPGPAFLACFGLAAREGRPAAARFVIGHLVGDITWGALALAAIIGVNQIGPALFDALGMCCGAYLVWLGTKALLARGDSQAAPVGARRPMLTGVLFGLTNPKSYPVSTAMFTAVALPFAGRLGWVEAPKLLGAAFLGFLLADAVIVFAAGLPVVRRFFTTHGRLLTRAVGVMFVAFGAKSLADAGRGFAGRS
jgi:threonine/homoserine/homoserine lactone efflux protein